jgi:hypothetical protein
MKNMSRRKHNFSRLFMFLGGPLLFSACGHEPAESLFIQTQDTAQRKEALTSAFDPNPSPRDGFRVVGKITPPSWSWGEIELLEGTQRFRTEGYNHRTE